jgi:hypothetical protein
MRWRIKERGAQITARSCRQVSVFTKNIKSGKLFNACRFTENYFTRRNRRVFDFLFKNPVSESLRHGFGF